MVTAVDLDNESDVIPARVEIDPTAGKAADLLPARLGQTSLPAHTREVELTQGVRSIAHVTHENIEQGVPGAVG